ncbi:MAG: tetratricopeptide repeat protein [FCB group bacterium]|nr:tetratricopeptide repeat protein [FCB group bacterium]
MSILAERDKVKTEMEAAKEAQDLDKYNELKTVFDDLNAKAEARKEFVLNEKKEAKRLLDDGSKYRRDKRWDKAEQSYAGALGKSDFIDQSIIPSIHLLIGFCQEQQKKYDSALVSYKTVTELDPKKAEAFEGMGRVYSKMNMKTESINAYKKAIELDPENAKAYFGLATGYYNVNMREDAEKYYAIAVEKDSTYDKAYYQLGVVRFKLRKYSEAVAALKKATEINKRYYLAFTFMAQIYNTTGDYAAAIDAAESSINIKSNYAQSHFEKGIALYHTERYNQALESFKKCLNDRTWREQAEYHIKLINDKTANQGLKNSEQ